MPRQSETPLARSGARPVVGQDPGASLVQSERYTPAAPNAAVGRVYDALLAVGSEWRGGEDWTCPSHEDEHASFGVAQGDKQAVVMKCQAGCSHADILKALGLQAKDLKLPTELIETYVYTDAERTPLYEVQRWEDPFGGKEFKQRALDSSGLFRRLPRGAKPMDGVGRVLWKLSLMEIWIRKRREIVIVEGEKSALAMIRKGYAATTATGGALAPWLPEYTECLRSARLVTVVADRDRNGYVHAAKVYDALTKAGIPTRIVQSKTTSAKDDVVDHFDAGFGWADMVPIERADCVWPDDAARASDVRRPEDDKPKSTAQLLVEIAHERYRFGQSTEGRAFAVPLGGPNVAREIGQAGRTTLQSELAAEFYDRHGKVASATALGDARSVLLGTAQRAEREPWALRVAQPEPHRIVIDLGDEAGKAVEVSPTGWKLLDASPVLFRRTEMVRSFPVPERGGSISTLQTLLNVDEAGFDFVVAWLVAAYFPDIAHAALMVNGEYGSAKTAATNLLVQLVDPSAALVQTAPSNLEAWATLAAGTYAVALENVSRLDDWLSDAICRAITGDGIVRRKLYSDGEMYINTFRRVVIINGIEVTGIRGDLGDRLATLELSRIQPHQRKQESVVKAEFHDAWPKLFGALLDLLSAVLNVQSDGRNELTDLPRLADFARVVRAVDVVRGTNALETYLDRATTARAQLAEDHPLTQSLVAMLSSSLPVRRWTGSPSDLLSELEHYVTDRRSLPKAASALSARLSEIAPNLREAGWHIENRKTNGRRIVEVEMPKRGPDGEERDDTNVPPRPSVVPPVPLCGDADLPEGPARSGDRPSEGREGRQTRGNYSFKVKKK